jgi:hypothetical protein
MMLRCPGMAEIRRTASRSERSASAAFRFAGVQDLRSRGPGHGLRSLHGTCVGRVQIHTGDGVLHGGLQSAMGSFWLTIKSAW